MLIYILFFSICILLMVGFPLTAYLEFKRDWAFHFKLCPHITLFPILFYWGILLVFWKMFYVIGIDWSIVVRLLIPSIAITIMALRIDLLSEEYLLLLELSDKAFVELKRFEIKNEMLKHRSVLKKMISCIDGNYHDEDEIRELVNQEIEHIPNLEFISSDNIIFDEYNSNNRIKGLIISKSDIKKCIKTLLLNSVEKHNRQDLRIKNKLRYKLWARLFLSYNSWNSKRDSFSLSRIFYSLSFFILVVTMIFAIFLIVYSWFIDKNDDRLPYLFGIGLFYTWWLPLRTYSNHIIKNKLYFLEEIDNNEASEFNENSLHVILNNQYSVLLLSRLRSLLRGRIEQFVYIFYAIFILFFSF